MISSIFFLSSSLMASSLDAELRLYGFPMRTLVEQAPCYVELISPGEPRQMGRVTLR